MKKYLTTIALMASFVLALVFTFSCSSDDDGDDGSVSSSSYKASSSSKKAVSSSSATLVSSSSLSSSSISSSSSTPNNSSSSSVPVTSNCSLNGGTVKIGDQVWMKENLNCNVSGSKCYNDDPANCATYGRLYDWATAMALPSDCNYESCASQIGSKHRGICPSGWHIPSYADWDKLMHYVDGSIGSPYGTSSPYSSPTAGRYLKATSGWNWNDYDDIPGNGEDTYGFSALPGGDGYVGGTFGSVGNYSYWWSASEYVGYYAYRWSMHYDDEGVRSSSHEIKSAWYYSVRCLQD